MTSPTPRRPASAPVASPMPASTLPHRDSGGPIAPSSAGASAGSETPGLGGGLVDVRGPRFGSALTSIVLAVALVVQGPVGVALVAFQVAVFAIATVFGVTHSPWAHLFRLVRRRAGLAPPTEFESATPPRFAQACGLAVAGGGLAALLVGATTVGWTAVATVLALATVLATSGLCIGCELWVLGQRAVSTTAGVEA